MLLILINQHKFLLTILVLPELPDYYLTIPNPISLNLIRKKLKNSEYADTEGLHEDLSRMFENCKKYNRYAQILLKIIYFIEWKSLLRNQ